MEATSAAFVGDASLGPGRAGGTVRDLHPQPAAVVVTLEAEQNRWPRVEEGIGDQLAEDQQGVINPIRVGVAQVGPGGRA